MKLFDEFGKDVGDFVPSGGNYGGIFAIAIFLLIGEFWLLYKFCEWTVRGFKMVFTGSSKGWLYLIPFLILAGVCIFGLLFYP